MYIYTFNLYITSKYICVLLRLKTNVSYCNVKHDSVRLPTRHRQLCLPLRIVTTEALIIRIPIDGSKNHCLL